MYSTDTSSGLMHFIASCADTQSQSSLWCQFPREAEGYAEQPRKLDSGATSLLRNSELSQQPQEFGYCCFPSHSRELQVHKEQSKYYILLRQKGQRCPVLGASIPIPIFPLYPPGSGNRCETKSICDQGLGSGVSDAPAPEPIMPASELQVWEQGPLHPCLCLWLGIKVLLTSFWYSFSAFREPSEGGGDQRPKKVATGAERWDSLMNATPPSTLWACSQRPA